MNLPYLTPLFSGKKQQICIGTHGLFGLSKTHIPINALDTHLYICGMTGKGKSRDASDRLNDFEFQYKGKCIYNRNVLGRQENHYFMIFEIYSDAKIVLNHESDDFRTFSRDELKRLIKEKPDMISDAFFPVIEACYPTLLGKE